MEFALTRSMNKSDKQIENSSDKPWLWKKGQSGNVKGRPKGKTLKEYCRDYLSKMTDDERDTFLEGMPKEIIWKMSEGNPETRTDVTSGDKPIAILNNVIFGNNVNEEDSETK